jgi:hypothetical protein
VKHKAAVRTSIKGWMQDELARAQALLSAPSARAPALCGSCLAASPGLVLIGVARAKHEEESEVCAARGRWAGAGCQWE